MNPIIAAFVAEIEAIYPASKPALDWLATNVNTALLFKIVAKALSDYQAGMSFAQILQDVAALYLTPEQAAALKSVQAQA